MPEPMAIRRVRWFMRHSKLDQTERYGDDGWAIPAFMVMVILGLIVFIAVLIVSSQHSAPSTDQVQAATSQLWLETNTATAPAVPFSTCTYDGRSWTPGDVFSCSVWTEASRSGFNGLFVHPNFVDHATVTVQSAPTGSSGYFATVSFKYAKTSALMSLQP